MKYCPIMSFQKECVSEVCCREENCAWWDNQTEQCIIKTLAQKPLVQKTSPIYNNSIISPSGGDR